MNFQKDFDVLFAAMLTDWRNQFPDADTSQGSLIYLKSACLASAVWGLYKYQEWIAAQIFPDTAETQQMEHHAWLRDIIRRVGEDDATLLARLLENIRRPPAGGNSFDYVNWALTIDNVKAAHCVPLGQGAGTVDVVIIADETHTGQELPSSYVDITATVTSLTALKLEDGTANFLDPSALVRIGDLVVNDDLDTEAKVTAIDSTMELSLDTDIFTVVGQTSTVKALTTQVKEYIDIVRPVTASAVRVLAPTITTQAVTMAITGAGVDKTELAASITTYINSLVLGETLYVSRLVAIAIDAGATNAVVSTPASDVIPATDEILRPGAITIT